MIDVRNDGEDMKETDTATQAATQPARKRSKKFKLLVAGLVVLVLALGATAVTFYKKYQDVKNNPAAVADQNLKAITEKVGKLITLPDETPTLADVQDISKLKDQPFFKNAQNGDNVLIFTAAKQAIIYRESTNKLINVGPISLAAGQPDDKSDAKDD